MAIAVKTIGTFGVSFSRGMDQTWVNLCRKDNGFLVVFFQHFEDMESDNTYEIIDEQRLIDHELGEQILNEAFENAKLESWKSQYTCGDEGTDTDLIWTIDVDDNADGDLLLLSGNRKLPPEDWMTAVIQAVRLGEDRFMRCVNAWK